MLKVNEIVSVTTYSGSRKGHAVPFRIRRIEGNVIYATPQMDESRQAIAAHFVRSMAKAIGITGSIDDLIFAFDAATGQQRQDLTPSKFGISRIMEIHNA